MQIKSYRYIWFRAIFIVITFVGFDFILNFTLYNPEFISPIYAFFLNHHYISDEDPGYPIITVHTLNSGLYSGPRASVMGTVRDVIKSGDGDWHIDIQDGSTVVAEIIPEYPLPLPIVGEQVQIWGITRYDISHRWWEIHPVIGWRKAN